MALKEYDYEKEPVVSIVKKILTDAIKMKATDIHFDPTKSELSIKFRINSNLQEYTIAPEEIKLNLTTRVKILANMNITDSLRPQTGTINFEVEGKNTSMRASTLPTCYGEKVVLHINNYENNIKSLSRIGINPEDTEKIKRLLKLNQGIILITGTASSGKTTTMYAMLKEIASKSINIISIEDPVKMQLDNINQVEISPDKGLTYKSALKYCLLQDPNIICIDDLIDDEITREIIRASITGRLVISSLYTKNAFTTIDTLLNMDIENYLLGANINGIISQRLIKSLCPHCKEKKQASEYEKKVIKKITNKDVDEIYYPQGCNECQNGYVNQIPIVEVIEITDEIKSAITNKKDRNEIRKLLYKNNNTILIDGFNHVISGKTSFDEIIRIMDIKADFKEDDKETIEYILSNNNINETKSTSFSFKIADVEEIFEEENNIEEISTPEIEEQEIEESEPLIAEHVTIPTPIEANIVEDDEDMKHEENNKDEEDDDDDDFNYTNYKGLI